jgi:hypothetical protein
MVPINMAPLALVILGALSLTVLFGCEQSPQQASRCLHYYQGDFGNYTKWGPCPSNLPRPWEDAGR